MELHRSDYHMHTDFSDGEDSPAKMLARCRRYGLRRIAKTDHDTVGGTLEAIVAAKRCGISFLPGIEITAMEKDLEIHVLGIGIDYTNYAVTRYSDYVHDLYKTRAVQIVGMIEDDSEHHWKVNPAVLRKEKGVITRSEISLAVQNIKMSPLEFFRDYLDEGKKYYAGIEKISVREAIEIIQSAGGKAIWAHSAFSLRGLDRKYSLLKLAKQFTLEGLDGLEVFYKKHSREETEKALKAVESFGLIPTTGSDFHRINESLPGQYRTYGRKICPKRIAERLNE